MIFGVGSHFLQRLENLAQVSRRPRWLRRRSMRSQMTWIASRNCCSRVELPGGSIVLTPAPIHTVQPLANLRQVVVASPQ